MTYAQTAEQRIRQAQADIAAARDAMQGIRRTVAATPPPIANAEDLSPLGLRKARDEQRAAIQQAADGNLAAQRAIVDQAVGVLQSIADSESLPVGDVIARQGQHWRRSEALLRAGHSPARVINDATDIEHLQALRAELPTYLSASSAERSQGQDFLGRMHQTNRPDPASHFLQAIDQRIADLGTGPTRDAAVARLALATDVPAANTAANGTANVVKDRSGGLAAALADHLQTSN